MRDLHAPQGLAKFHQELPLMKLLFGYQWIDVGHVSRRPEWLNLYKLQSCYESSGRTGRNANCAVAPLAHCKLQACRTQLVLPPRLLGVGQTRYYFTTGRF